MNKPLYYSRHAETVIAERQLDREWIEQAVRETDWSIANPSGEGSEQRFKQIAEAGGRHIRIICVETDREIRMISAFLDRGARRPT